jgi:diguanylate cyclase (GGDEF)-like protein
VPTEETLLTVILVAIAVNVVVAVGILIASRRGRLRNDAAGRPRPHPATASTMASPRPLATVFGGPPRGEHVVDPQTGFDVAMTWERWLAEEDARLRRYRRPVTVVLVEIDGLDRLEERLGPAVADRLIPPMAATLRGQGRAADRFARLSRSRFGVVLPETDEVQAINYVERVRQAADLWLEAGAVATRLSIGWAACDGASSATLADATVAAESRLHAERRRRPTDGAVDAVPPRPVREAAAG